MFDSTFRPAGGITPIWSAGLFVRRGGYVVSPADSEIYRRVTDSGTSGTDPADDTTNYVAASFDRTTSLWVGANTVHTNTGSNSLFGGSRVLSGNSLPVGARTPALFANGRGELMHVSTQRWVDNALNIGTQVEIIVDGRSIYNANLFSSGPNVACHFGTLLTKYNGAGGDFFACEATKPIQFRRSLQVYVTPTYQNWGTSDRLVYLVRALA